MVNHDYETQPEVTLTLDEKIANLKIKKDDLESKLTDWKLEFTTDYVNAASFDRSMGVIENEVQAKAYVEKLIDTTKQKLAKLEADSENLLAQSRASTDSNLPVPPPIGVNDASPSTSSPSPSASPSASSSSPPAKRDAPEIDPKAIELLSIEFKKIKFNDAKFNILYKALVENNPNKTADGKSLKLFIPIPSDQTKKEQLFDILSAINQTVDFNMIEEYLKLISKAPFRLMSTAEKDSLRVKMLLDYDAIKNEEDTDDFVSEQYLQEFITKKEFTKKDADYHRKQIIDAKLNAIPSLDIKQKLVHSVTSDIFLLQDKFQNQSRTSEKDVKFSLTEAGGDSTGWWLGIIPLPVVSELMVYLRDGYRSYGTVSFSSDAKGRAMLEKKRADAAAGVKNEFSLASSFMGTDAQKAAAQSAIIVGVASCGWAIVGKIQQNPALAAIMVGAISATGVGGVAVGIGLIACGVAYYAMLTLKTKYSKYYEINRTLNELTILLHRIQKLIRLSVLISNTYNFDININEIIEQLRILFSRFDQMLNGDDYDGIQGMINKNATPDLDLTAVVTTAAVAAQKDIVEAAEQKSRYQKMKESMSRGMTAAKEKLAAMGKGLGTFVYIMSFDDELWNRKLNDDIVKLNIYLTTTIGEFNIVLNILQMGLITKGFSGDKKAIADLTNKNHHVTQSSEYTRMLIGILLNDILKLRADLSYCSRGTTTMVNTTTKDEPICLNNYQDFDGAGNQITTFRRKLHSMIITLVGRLNDSTAVYAEMKSLKAKIKKEVVEPYIALLTDTKLEDTPEFKTRHFLKPDKRIEPSHMSMFEDKKREELGKIRLIQAGGVNWFSRKSSEEQEKEDAAKKAAEAAKQAIKESEVRAKKLAEDNALAAKAAEAAEIAGKDDKILQYLISEPYATILDVNLSTFLTNVYQFSKTESKTTEAETKDALKTAAAAAELAPDAKVVAQQADDLKNKEAAVTMAADVQHDAETTKDGKDGKDGGRRLTRKKRRANKKKVRQTKAVKKYNNYNARVAMKGKFLKKMS